MIRLSWCSFDHTDHLLFLMLLWPFRSIITGSSLIGPILIPIRSESIASIGEGRTSTSFVISSFLSDPLSSTVTRRDLFLLLVYHLFFNTNIDIDTDNTNDTNTVPSSCDPDEALQVFCISTDSIIPTASSPTTSPVATAANSPTVYVQNLYFDFC